MPENKAELLAFGAQAKEGFTEELVFSVVAKPEGFANIIPIGEMQLWEFEEGKIIVPSLRIVAETREDLKQKLLSLVDGLFEAIDKDKEKPNIA